MRAARTGRQGAAFVLACLVLSSALAVDDPRPRILIASHGGSSVELQGRVLRYSRGTRKEDLRPAPRQWRAFRRALDEIDIWSWRASYERPVTDGFAWKVHIEYADRRIDTHGYAAVPDMRAFTRYLYALQTLTGGRIVGFRRVNELELFEVSELRLVATHPSRNRAEQWAALRDPRGRLHRLSHDPGENPGFSYLAAVAPGSVTLREIVVDEDGDLVYRTAVLRGR